MSLTLSLFLSCERKKSCARLFLPDPVRLISRERASEDLKEHREYVCLSTKPHANQILRPDSDSTKKCFQLRLGLSFT